jgi:hypothetical protein
VQGWKVDGMIVSSIVLTAALVLAPSVAAERGPVAVTSFKTFEPSQYRGKWFSPKWASERKCIMHHESRFNYRARNDKSSAAGAYQFLDNYWRDSLVWMMLKESNETNDGLQDQVKLLRSKNISQWTRYWQDRAFYTVWMHGEGKKHWSLQAHKCF